jgi:hypothetical protein
MILDLKINHSVYYLYIQSFNLFKEGSMDRTRVTQYGGGTGVFFWFAGWLFTIAFGQLVWWQAILGLVIWPYYLGIAAM